MLLSKATYKRGQWKQSKITFKSKALIEIYTNIVKRFGVTAIFIEMYHYIQQEFIKLIKNIIV